MYISVIRHSFDYISYNKDINVDGIHGCYADYAINHSVIGTKWESPFKAGQLNCELDMSSCLILLVEKSLLHS